MTAHAIEAIQLNKDYGDGRGCRDVTLTIRKGKPLASSVLMEQAKARLSKCSLV